MRSAYQNFKPNSRISDPLRDKTNQIILPSRASISVKPSHNLYDAFNMCEKSTLKAFPSKPILVQRNMHRQKYFLLFLKTCSNCLLQTIILTTAVSLGGAFSNE